MRNEKQNKLFASPDLERTITFSIDAETENVHLVETVNNKIPQKDTYCLIYHQTVDSVF